MRNERIGQAKDESLPAEPPYSLQIKKVVVIIPAAFSPSDDDLVLFLLFALVLRNSIQELFELILGYFLSELACLCQHDQPVLDVECARFLDETYTTETISGCRVEDLGQDGSATFR